MWARFLFEFLIFIYRWNIQCNLPTVWGNAQEEEVQGMDHAGAGTGDAREILSWRCWFKCVFSLQQQFSSSAQSLQETHTANIMTALYNISKIQHRQPKSVKLPRDKQGFLQKKKKKSIYTHHSDHHPEFQGILPSLFWKLHKYYIAGCRPHILAIWTDLRGILTSQWCECTYPAENAQGKNASFPSPFLQQCRLRI